jgi:hypothetical protein
MAEICNPPALASQVLGLQFDTTMLGTVHAFKEVISFIHLFIQ